MNAARCAVARALHQERRGNGESLPVQWTNEFQFAVPVSTIHRTSQTMNPVPAPDLTPTSGAGRVPAVYVHTVEELREAYTRQRELYDWDFSSEREFMENLFCTRFNSLLVAYS